MSLWSPVDLVTGGTGTRNISTSSTPSSINNNSVRTNSALHYGTLKTKCSPGLLHQQQQQQQGRNLKSLAKNLATSEESNASSDTLPAYLNSSIMSDRELLATKLIPPAHTSLISRCSSISCDSKPPETIVDNANSNNHSINTTTTISSSSSRYKRRHSESETDSSVDNQSDIKKSRLRDRMSNSSSVGKPSPSQYHNNQSQPLPLLKTRNDVGNLCDNPNEVLPSQLAASKSSKNDIDVPLNLCMKRTVNTPNVASNQDSDSYQRNNDSHHCDQNRINVQSVNNERILQTVPNEIQQQKQPKRRGRKPKSILAATSNSLPIIVVPATDECKPRKRGRPPILSPPLLPPKINTPTSSAQDSSSISNRLFTGALPLTSTNSTLLQPGWPTFTSTGVVVFPTSANGDRAGKEHNNCKGRPPDCSDANSMGSGEESKRGESDSEEENDEDSDSDSQQSSNRDDDNKKMPVSRLMPDEKEIRIPLNYGWRRQTVIRCFSRSGVRGDVVYFAPCGKKLKSYPEVIRYLQKSNINDITRDNFSYSSKLNIGEFLEPLTGTNNDYKMLTEDQVKLKIDEVRRSGRRRLGIKGSRKRTRRSEEPKCAPAEPAGLRSTQPVNFSQSAADGAVADLSKSREQDEVRREAEIFKRVQERELRKYQAEIQKEQEVQRRRELQMMAEIERERRKQHILLVRALDAHKRQEERERKREEMLAEKRLMQERRLQKKRLEMELLKELKKPVDDMMLKDLQPLPAYSRIPGIKLPGKAFADILMVYEFLHNFGETLGFDMDSLPSLNTLQQAVLNMDPSAEEELLSIIHHLLVCVIDDPGMPCNMTTIMGQKLKDAPITNYNITEILRLYFQAFASQARTDTAEERIEVKIYNVLKTGKPYLAVNVSLKAEILAFLCDELLCNQAIVRQIEDNIESVSNLRRDKWVVETDLRRYKSMKHKREKETEDQEDEEPKKEEKPEAEPAAEESDSSDSEEHIVGLNAPDEEPELSNDDLDRKVEALSRKCTIVTNKLNKAIHGLRVTSLGQDRFRRRYWVLPSTGGLYVEGLESAEPEGLDPIASVEDESVADVEPVKKEIVSEEKSEESESREVSENKNDAPSEDVNEVSVKTEEPSDLIKTESNGEQISNCSGDIEKEQDKLVAKAEVVTDLKDGLTVNRLDEVKKEKVEPEEKANEKQPSKLPDGTTCGGMENPWFSPIVASVLAGSMMFGNNSNHSNNGFGAFPFNFPMELSNNHQKSPQMPWFSILPRMPCSKNTILTDPSRKPKTTESFEEKEKAKAQSDPDFNQSQFGSLISNLPTNLFMQAFLYPHLLGSLFQQNRTSGPLPDATNRSPQSSVSFPTKTSDTKGHITQERSQSRPTSPSTGKVEFEGLTLNTQFCDIDICPSLQRKLAEQKEEQYSEPQKIPVEYQRGWWRVSDISQLRQLMDALHERGARERQLHKYLTKHYNHVSNKCKAPVTDLVASDEEEGAEESFPHGAPLTPSIDDWSEEVALKLDIAVLEQVEALEEKIASSSMQVRGWRPPPRKSNDDTVRFKLSEAYFDGEAKEAKPGDDEAESSVNPVMVARERLLAAEAVIERRYLKPPLGYKSNTLIVPSSLSHHNSDELADNAADENAPNGLIRWREAVRECRTGSELALLLHFLESCIAWDKSIMRASCQFCGSGENEAQLLLCDGCDKGYHTYCFKPKMETIPEGDWFCYECQNKNTIDKVCIVCGKKGKLLNCDTCPKVFHPNCIDPPVTKPPKGRWSCNMCNRKPKKPKYSRKSSSTGTTSEEKVSKELIPAASSSTIKENKRNGSASKSKKEVKVEMCEKETKKEKKVKEKDKEMTFCETLLSEMEKHEDSWPFLLPVNTKQFPTYKKIIKKPMDLQAIRNRLESGGYKSKADFMNDCRLIFDNCETFNEDESPVGIAGHNMRKYFDKRTKELFEKS